MSFLRPSLLTLIDRAQTDIDSRIQGADSRLRRSVLGVLARVLAGVSHGLHGHLDYISKQILPDKAEAEELARHASIWLKNQRLAATFAAGSAAFTGNDGVVIPAGTAMQRSDGETFTTDADGTIASGTVTIALTADVAGVSGNCAAFSKLQMISAIAGAEGEATIDVNGLTGGVDIESDDSLRARVLDRIQNPPHGGADFDYITWAKEVAGVTRAWVYAQELGFGTVTVRFMMDEAYADGIPLAADVTTVQDYIDTVRPVTSDATVVAPVAVPMNFNITGLSPSTAAVKAAIEDELKDLLEREAIPGGTILISHIREAISIAAGEVDHVLVTPAADVTHSTGEIATFGVITW